MSSEEAVFDAWVQHPTPRLLKAPFLASILRWLKIDNVPEGEIPIEFTVEAMRAAGVKKALLSAWYAPEGALISNEEVAKWMRLAPELFLGACSVNLRQPMEAVRELRRCVNEGFSALRIMPWLWELPPNDRRYYPLYAACVDLGLPVCLQVGRTGPLRSSEVGRPIPYLDEVALDFPELVIVAGHIGYPWTEEMISLAEKYPNVYIDTSAYKPKRYPESLVKFMAKRGREKVLFASDHPMINPFACLSQLDDLGLDAEARRLFLYENAARVFGVSAA